MFNAQVDPRLHPIAPIVTPTFNVPGRGWEMLFGYRDIVIETRTIDLSAALGGGASGEGQKLDIGGTLLWAVDGTSSAAKLEVKFNDQGGWVPYKKGLKIGGVPFDHLFVRCAGQAGESITLLWATDYPDQQVTED